MFVRLFLVLIAALLISGPAWPDAIARLAIDATPAIVQVRPLAEGRKLIRLPALEFHLTVLADCADDTEIRSVSISVADTRTTISGDDVVNLSAAPVSFSVPARQLSPIAVDGFCPLANGAGGLEELLIRDAVTAHLSLRCAGKSGEAIIYVSHALDVMLQCPMRGDDQRESVSEIAK